MEFLGVYSVASFDIYLFFEAETILLFTNRLSETPGVVGNRSVLTAKARMK